MFQKIKNKLLEFIHNTKAEIDRVISIVLALFVAGVLLPTALVAIAGGNYTGVDSSVKTIATILLPVLAVIAISLIFLKTKKS